MLESESGLQWFTRLKDQGICLSTGHFELDELLKGSIPLKQVTEIFGEAGIGKIEFLITIVAKLLICPKKKSTWVVIVFDYNGTFRTDRLLDAIRFFEKCDDKNFGLSLLNRVFIERIYTCEELKNAFSRVTKEFKTSNLIPLILVNEIGAILSDTSFSEQEGFFYYVFYEQDQVLKLMREFCSTSGGTIISTNHVVHWRGFPSPALGSTWSNGITSRIMLSRDESTGKLSASLELQNKLIEKVVEYTISNGRFEKALKYEFEEPIKTEPIDKLFKMEIDYSKVKLEYIKNE